MKKTTLWLFRVYGVFAQFKSLKLKVEERVTN